ncbi:type III secretion system translocon subunit SctE [Dongshaea marina]|uniref:type III secretion system translocon subunit SctE n=1 Tax=Dongshaea marina TaxID=2047966 RepID=UPI000D3EC936|nr:type III secretion system translocon subunit SctE [Dongshaea marina]
MNQNIIGNDIFRTGLTDSILHSASGNENKYKVSEFNLEPSRWVSDRHSRMDQEKLGIHLPEPKNRQYTTREHTDRALKTLFGQLQASPDKVPKGSSTNQISSMSVDSLSLYISLLVTDGFNARAKDLVKALDALHDRQKLESSAKLKDQIEAINKNVEQAHKAQKNNIFTAILDWVMSAVEVVLGAIKLAAAVVTCNPVGIAGGVAEIGAGLTGFVKAALETAALCQSDPEKAQKLREAANIVGYVQMGLGIVAAALDITQTARATMAATKAANAAKVASTAGDIGEKVTKTVVAQAAGKITEAESKVILEKIGKELAQELIQTATKDVAKGITEEAAKELLKKAAQQAVEQAAKEASKVFAKEGLEAAAKAAAETIATTVKQEVKDGIKSLTKAIVTSAARAATDFVSGGISSFYNFAMKREMADLQKEISDLLADQQMMDSFLEVLNQMMDKQRSRVKETLKMISDGQNTTQSNIENLSNASGMMANMMGKV